MLSVSSPQSLCHRPSISTDISSFMSRCAHLLRIAGDSLYECACLTFPLCLIYVTQTAEYAVSVLETGSWSTCIFIRMLGSAFLISPTSLQLLSNSFYYPATHFLWCLACFCFLTSCHMEASIQGQIAVPPHTNSLAFFFFVCAVLACQQKWAGMDGFALRVTETVIERGKRGTGIQGYSLMGLTWLLFHCVTPFPSPFLCLLYLCLSSAICFWAQMRMFVVAETPALQTKWI